MNVPADIAGERARHGAQTETAAVSECIQELESPPTIGGGGSSSREFLWIYVAVAGSLFLRASLLDFESRDYTVFLSRGYDFFIEHGRWHGLSLISDQFDASYPPLFLYLLSLRTLLPVPKLYAIKLISIAADYLGACLCGSWSSGNFHTGADRGRRWRYFCSCQRLS